MLLHNRKEMYRRTDTNKRDNYTRYMKEVYNSDKCILCKENKVDDREHYKVCEFSKEKYDKILDEMENIIKRKSGKEYVSGPKRK
jgi:hypothetical protein